MNTHEYISQNIKYLRDIKNLNQEEFGKLFGVQRSTVACWESGERKPKTEILREIAKHYDIIIDDLLYCDLNAMCKEAKLKSSKSKEYLDEKLFLYEVLKKKEIINKNGEIEEDAYNKIIQFLEECNNNIFK